MKLLALALLAGVAIAQFTPKITIPDQISGRSVSFDPTAKKVNNRPQNFFAFAYWQYDHELERQWYKEDIFEGENNHDKHQLEVLELYPLRAIYVTDWDNEKEPKCKMYTMDKNSVFPSLKPAANAKFHGTAELGIPPIYGTHPETLQMAYFGWNQTNTQYKTTTTVWSQYAWAGPGKSYDTSEPGFPLEFHYRDEAYGFVYQQFTDCAIGIEDPDAFLPPKDCEPAEEGESFRYNIRSAVGYGTAPKKSTTPMQKLQTITKDE